MQIPKTDEHTNEDSHQGICFFSQNVFTIRQKDGWSHNWLTVEQLIKFDRFFFSINIKKIKTQKSLHSTVPSKAGIDTRSSGPYFG